MTRPSGGGQQPVIFAFPESAAFARRLAAAMDAPLGRVAFHDFPDGETLVRLDSDVASREAIVVLSWRRPNPQLLPLLFLADALREGGATRIGLLSPYLAYLRQDARFQPGEAITSRTFAKTLSAAVDWIAAVDPHLHRLPSLSAIYSIPAMAIHVGRVAGTWIAAHVERPFIIGPDGESQQWVNAVTNAAGAASTVLTKSRRGDTEVIESIPDLASHRLDTPVLVDDIISSGGTMAAAIAHLRNAGARAPVCVGIHAVFADGALEALTAAGAARVVTTNSIRHPTNAIDIVPAVADALRESGYAPATPSTAASEAGAAAPPG